MLLDGDNVLRPTFVVSFHDMCERIREYMQGSPLGRKGGEKSSCELYNNDNMLNMLL